MMRSRKPCEDLGKVVQAEGTAGAGMLVRRREGRLRWEESRVSLQHGLARIRGHGVPCLAPLRDGETHCGQNEVDKGKTWSK